MDLFVRCFLRGVLIRGWPTCFLLGYDNGAGRAKEYLVVLRKIAKADSSETTRISYLFVDTK
jgi:hypothetical protein